MSQRDEACSRCRQTAIVRGRDASPLCCSCSTLSTFAASLAWISARLEKRASSTTDRLTIRTRRSAARKRLALQARCAQSRAVSARLPVLSAVALLHRTCWCPRGAMSKRSADRRPGPEQCGRVRQRGQHGGGAGRVQGGQPGGHAEAARDRQGSSKDGRRREHSSSSGLRRRTSCCCCSGQPPAHTDVSPHECARLCGVHMFAHVCPVRLLPCVTCLSLPSPPSTSSPLRLPLTPPPLPTTPQHG